MKPKTHTPDVLIIGGGLSGLTLAALLGRAGAEVAVVDRAVPATQLAKGFDARTTALSYASHLVLKDAGAWEEIKKVSAPMSEIRVADGGCPLYLHFDSAEDGGREAFGWNLENAELRRILYENARAVKTVRHFAPAEIGAFVREENAVGVTLKDGAKIMAPLMVGADGRGSAVRDWCGIGVRETDTGQTAIVCNIAHELDHEGVAVEHFLPDGPFAVLPLTKGAGHARRSSVVWTVPHAAAPGILALNAQEFDARLQDLCGPHLGAVQHVSPPRGYPLLLMHADGYAASRVALMAEAAHVIHPIAGQGLNLSMRDAALLSGLILERLRVGLDPGAEGGLKDYAGARRFDTHLMAGFTDGLNHLFSNDLISVAALRGAGLGLVQKMPILKGFFARQAMGLGGRGRRRRA